MDLPLNPSLPAEEDGGPHPDISKFVATIRKRFAFSAQEADELSARIGEIAVFGTGELLVHEGQRVTYSSLILEGYACRFKETEDGVRQIMEIQIPGDFVDLHSYPLEVLDHSIGALTECRIAKLYHDQITQLVEKSPRFARILWFSTMVDASMHREWMLNLGARNGRARIAHLICEVYYRSETVGLTDGKAFRFPLTQTQIGDCLGYTQMHVNRSIKAMRDDGLLHFHGQVLHILDWERLQAIAQFDPGYLYLNKREG